MTVPASLDMQSLSACFLRMRRLRSFCQTTLRSVSVFVIRWFQRRFSTSPEKHSTTAM